LLDPIIAGDAAGETHFFFQFCNLVCLQGSDLPEEVDAGCVEFFLQNGANT